MDWDWTTWAIVVGCTAVVLLPLFAVGVILIIIATLRRRDRSRDD
jgi:hypothetical protein